MGAWGMSLYENDTTKDVRDDYIDKLRQGKSNEEATQEMIDKNNILFGDAEEEPLFWFALADTQWDYGRLLPRVKEKADFFLSQTAEVERWGNASTTVAAWLRTREQLREKINSPQPPQKRVPKYRIYQCQWRMGDIFAYRFSSEYSRTLGYENQYVIFRKISECVYYPKHIIPIVQVYKWIGYYVPELSALSSIPLLELNYTPELLAEKPKIKKVYQIALISTSKRSIPKNNIVLLGNLPGDDITPFQGYNRVCNIPYVGWEGSVYNNKFEHHVLNMYSSWK